MKFVFRIFLFLAISSFCMEIVYSLVGETSIELLSSDNTDDDSSDDSDDSSDENEEKQDKTDNLFAAYALPETMTFAELNAPVLYAETDYPIAFHLIEPPYSPPEMM
jgi:hypothetical protein